MKIKMLSFGAVIATFLINGCALPELPKPTKDPSVKEVYYKGSVKYWINDKNQECYQDSGTGKAICRAIIDNDELIENIKKMK